jgi:hypothetical protein
MAILYTTQDHDLCGGIDGVGTYVLAINVNNIAPVRCRIPIAIRENFLLTLPAARSVRN